MCNQYQVCAQYGSSVMRLANTAWLARILTDKPDQRQQSFTHTVAGILRLGNAGQTFIFKQHYCLGSVLSGPRSLNSMQSFPIAMLSLGLKSHKNTQATLFFLRDNVPIQATDLDGFR